jgi:8-oxo-dGTP pyrophosphatase MutT (NUDIX family)
MYKVFVNDRVIYFTNNKEIFNNSPKCLKLRFFSESITESICSLLLNGRKKNSVVIEVDNPEAAFNQFKNYFRLIEAAGGRVKNEAGKTLFIYRLDKWDLPKGKKEEGETIKETAIREVEEECGITGLNLGKQLQDTFHIYSTNKGLVLKQTYWFEMTTNYSGELTPQTEEGITKVEWLTDEEVKTKVLENTYESLVNVIN